MGILLNGTDVTNGMRERLADQNRMLIGKGIVPCIAIVRVGERQDDLAYERNALKRFESLGIKASVSAFPESVTQELFVRAFREINEDQAVHGILLLRPLPKSLDEEEVKRIINPAKDIDGMSAANMAKVFMGDETGFAPCTPAAVIALLKCYEIPLSGRRVTLIGRSMVVGKPLAMLLVKEDATVTVCHSKTADLQAECSRADIVIAATGIAKMVKKEHIKPGAVVIDVGINVDEDGLMCGDVDFDDVLSVASAITPVPGGVGSLTTSILAAHTLKAAEKSL